uniref:Cupin-like domain-containing protein n=1 Tax=Tetraselmis sp. GSL018 TaxID=582737 RepID=A0A061SJK6_9CHLO
MWRSRYGHRLVPVETWKSGVQLENMLLGDFISRFLVPSNQSLKDVEAVCAFGPFPRADQVCEAANTAAAAGASDGGRPPPANIGYVSQHGLFHQLKQTQEEFSVPAYARGGGRLAMVNVWMGTRGTVTHLHTDEHDNLLAQVCGFKFVRTCGPAYRASLRAAPHPRAAEGRPLNWFSPVHAEMPDLHAYPEAAEVRWKDTSATCSSSPRGTGTTSAP